MDYMAKLVVEAMGLMPMVEQVVPTDMMVEMKQAVNMVGKGTTNTLYNGGGAEKMPVQMVGSSSRRQ